MTPRQIEACIIISSSLLVLIVTLIRKKKLDTAYSWVWLFIGISMVMVVVFYDGLIELSDLIGSMTPTTTLFLCAILVIFLLCVQFSIVTSQHKWQIRKLAQELAMLNGQSETSASQRPSDRLPGKDRT
ncbi:MAG: DUF2304 domain-containing protein [Desulfomonilaceae bacterium]